MHNPPAALLETITRWWRPDGVSTDVTVDPVGAIADAQDAAGLEGHAHRAAQLVDAALVELGGGPDAIALLLTECVLVATGADHAAAALGCVAA
jgi:hypothetical protein